MDSMSKGHFSVNERLLEGSTVVIFSLRIILQCKSIPIAKTMMTYAPAPSGSTTA